MRWPLNSAKALGYGSDCARTKRSMTSAGQDQSTWLSCGARLWKNVACDRSLRRPVGTAGRDQIQGVECDGADHVDRAVGPDRFEIDVGRDGKAGVSGDEDSRQGLQAGHVRVSRAKPAIRPGQHDRVGHGVAAAAAACRRVRRGTGQGNDRPFAGMPGYGRDLAAVCLREQSLLTRPAR